MGKIPHSVILKSLNYIMATLSKTVLCTKDEDTLYKFFKRYEGRKDVTRQIDLNPDKFGFKTCTITYNEPSLNNQINQMLHSNDITKTC